MGWLEKEGSLLPDEIISVSALWPTCFGRSNRGGQAPMKKEGCLHAARTEGRQVDPSPTPLPARVGHRLLSRSERSVLSHSFKERSVLSRSFFAFLATYETQKNGKER